VIVFWVFFALVIIVSILFQVHLWRKEKKKVFQPSAEFRKFQRVYLVPFALFLMANWLQGQFLFSLYIEKGFNKVQIVILCITWVSSSLIFGTLVGPLADKYGRKLWCIFCGILSIFSCFFMVAENFAVAIIGRIIAGISTSIFYSSFEAWMVSEHNQKNYSQEWLTNTLSLAAVVQALVAMPAVFLGDIGVDKLGAMTPVVLALVFFIIPMVLIYFQWTENFGNAEMRLSGVFLGVWSDIRDDKSIPLVGVSQAFFEASLILLLFGMKVQVQELFTPLVDIYSVVFCTVMGCVIIGVSIFRVMLQYLIPTVSIYRSILILSTICFGITYFVNENVTRFILLNIFAICCGIHVPCSATLRVQYIAEEHRAAIINFFRVPLNLVLIGILVTILYHPLDWNTNIYLICGCLLFFAAILQHIVSRRSRKPTIVVISGDSNWAV